MSGFFVVKWNVEDAVPYKVYVILNEVKNLPRFFASRCSGITLFSSFYQSVDAVYCVKDYNYKGNFRKNIPDYAESRIENIP